MNTSPSTPDTTEPLSPERHQELLAFRFRAEDQLGLNPLNGFPDTGECNEGMFRRRVMEMPARVPTEEQFALMLGMGEIFGHTQIAIQALQLYAYDESYPFRREALAVLALQDTTAALILQKLRKADAQSIQEKLATEPQAPVHRCIHEGRH